MDWIIQGSSRAISRLFSVLLLSHTPRDHALGAPWFVHDAFTLQCSECAVLIDQLNPTGPLLLSWLHVRRSFQRSRFLLHAADESTLLKHSTTFKWNSETRIPRQRVHSLWVHFSFIELLKHCSVAAECRVIYVTNKDVPFLNKIKIRTCSYSPQSPQINGSIETGRNCRERVLKKFFIFLFSE